MQNGIYKFDKRNENQIEKEIFGNQTCKTFMV